MFAYALIFASFAHLRWIQTLSGRGDELVFAEQFSAKPNRLLVAGFVFLLGLPPILAAYRIIANRRRKRVFIASYLLPLPVLFVLLFGDRFLFEASQLGRQYGAFLGIWLTVLVTDLAASAVFILFAPRYLSPPARGEGEFSTGGS